MINNSLFAHQLNYGLHELFFLILLFFEYIFDTKKIIMQEIDEILSLLLERFKTS